MKILRKGLSLIIVGLLVFIVYALGLKCNLVPESVRNPVSQFTEEIQSAAADIAVQVSAVAEEAKEYAHSLDPAFPAPVSQAKVKTPVTATDLNSVWGETGMKGLAVYEYGKTLLNKSERAIYCEFAAAVADVKKQTAFSTTLSPTQVEKIYDYYVYDHTEVFYSSGVQFQYIQYGKLYQYTISFRYKYGGDKAKITAMRAELRQKALSMLGAVKGFSTDLKKEKALHDALINACSYDVNAVQNSDAYPDSYSAYGALVKNKAVCQGYAQAMKLLLSSCGIKCLYVSGQANGGDHAWNVVQIGGKWYSLDATFDDPVFYDGDGNNTSVSTVSYTYFNFIENLGHKAGKFNSSAPLSDRCENYAVMPKIG